MIRDFTDETKYMLGDALEDWYDKYTSSPITDNITLTVDILGQNCVLDGWEIDNEANKLMRDEELNLTNQEAMKHMLDEIFEEARAYDALASVSVFDTVDVAAEPFISTLRKLVEKINVSSLGNDAESVRYNFGRYHGGYENSIFGSSEQFKASLDNIGYGLLQTTYDNLNPEVNGWDNFDALMSKNPDEVKLCELWALSMIVDSYLETNAETGQIVLNTEKYEEFLEHCYKLTSFHEGLSQPDVMLTSYTKFELSPVAVMFAGYRAEYTKSLLDMYGKCIYSCEKYSYETSLLVAECQVDDVLTAMVLYGQEVIEDGLVYRKEKPTMDVSICFFGNPPNDLTVSLFQQTDISIYGLSDNLGNEFSNANKDAAEEGKIDISNAMLGVICSTAVDFGADYIGKLPIVGPVVGTGYKIYSVTNDVYSTYQNVKTENELRDKYIHDIKSSDYISALHIGGAVIQCGDNATINHVICDKNQLMVDVAFYNYDENNNTEISVDQLQAEFNSYINGGETDILDKFADYDNGDIGCDYRVYCKSIETELTHIREEKQKNGEDVSIEVVISTATPEEVQEAIDRVNQKGNQNEN